MSKEQNFGHKQLSILIINNYFPPEIGAASHLYYYLARELVKRGHKVTVLTGIPRYNVDFDLYKDYLKKMKNSSILLEDTEGIKVIRAKLPYIDRRKVIRRGLEHFEIAFKLFYLSKKLIKKMNIDVSLVYSPPLTLYWTANKVKNSYGAPFILNVQDLFPQAFIDLGIIKNPLLIRFFKYLEKRAYKKASIITVHSENNKHFVESILGDNKKVFVIENWIDENEIIPGEKENKFSLKYNLSDKFVVSFAGTLGYSQDAEVIIKAANELQNFKDIVFLIVGNGSRINEVKFLIDKMNLSNVMLLPPVSREDYPLVLHSSDVSLATLRSEVKTPTVPSKIISIMSAGRPVIAAMNLDGDAPKLIERSKSGFCVPAGDYKALAEKIVLLYENPSLKEKLGCNGRKYIEENLSASKAAEIYEQLFYKILAYK